MISCIQSGPTGVVARQRFDICGVCGVCGMWYVVCGLSDFNKNKVYAMLCYAMLLPSGGI